MEGEKRRLQELGGSLYVSLPSSWINQFNLTKGSQVFILSEDGQLKLFPKESPKEEEKTSIIHFTKGVFRILIREYLLGVDIIRIKKDTPFSNSDRSQIASQVNNFLSLEIVEETSNLITIQNLKSDIPITKLIHRMYYLTKSMLEDLNQEDKEVLLSVIERDKLVGKFYFAIIMQERALLTNKWSQEFSFVELLDLRLLIERIEQIGDDIKELAGKLLSKDKIKKEDINFLLQKYDQAFKAYTKKDTVLAAKFWDTEKEDKKRVEYNEQLLRIYSKIKDIADLII
ncbi:phosphate uptake regulator PhoU [archaeon]|nr:phosphate uptake regulator PhoU [archaeon]